MEFNLYSFLAVIVFTSVAVCIDLKTRRIPNWLTVSGAIAGLVFHLATGGIGGLLFSLAGFGTGFGVLLILWLIGGGGGGDVKLMGAVGAWLGALPTLLIFIGSAVFALVCTIGVISWSHIRTKREGGAPQDDAEPRPSVLKQTIPYALPVAMSIWALFVFQLIQA